MSQPRSPGAAEVAVSLERRMFCASALAAGVALACGGGGGSPAPTPPGRPGAGPHPTTDTKAALLATADGTARDYRNLDFFLLKDAAGIYAMTTVCTHLGCTVGLPAGTRILCPCHGSQYDLQGGNQVGPATQPLVHFEVTEPTPGGVLLVNTAQTVAAATRLT